MLAPRCCVADGNELMEDKEVMGRKWTKRMGSS